MAAPLSQPAAVGCEHLSVALGGRSVLHQVTMTAAGGQRLRTLLAQGLARGADLLLLDEPTTGLDTASTGTTLAAINAERARGA